MLRIILIALSAVLYRIGGKGGFKHAKLVRRLGCPTVMVLPHLLNGLWLSSLLAWVLLFSSFTVPYGTGRWIDNKYLARALCGLLYAVACLPLLWGSWWLFSFHAIVTTLGVTLAGNQKFSFDDNREESYIGLIVSTAPIFGG